jgi:glycine C-acetyltransferase
VDILTGTFGKALGGASGGYTSGRKEIIELLRQRSRPYLFSNTIAPAVAAASIKALEMVSASTELLEKLQGNTQYFRSAMRQIGYKIPDGVHPIVPVMLGEATLAVNMAEQLLKKEIYVVGFSYPVVPKGAARIRIQMSAGFSRKDLDFALEQWQAVGKELKVI